LRRLVVAKHGVESRDDFAEASDVMDKCALRFRALGASLMHVKRRTGEAP
jgi:hypothetical protein